MKVNLIVLKEDLRKMAIALMIAGLASYILESVGIIKSSIIAIVGLIFWIFGLVDTSVQEDE